MIHPEKEWRKVVNHLGLNKVPHSELLKVPSQQSAIDMRGSRFTSGHIERWSEQLDHDAIDGIAEMLEQFGSRLYSIDSAMPNGDVAMFGSDA
jgi:hypothetical protein